MDILIEKIQKDHQIYIEEQARHFEEETKRVKTEQRNYLEKERRNVQAQVKELIQHIEEETQKVQDLTEQSNSLEEEINAKTEELKQLENRITARQAEDKRFQDQLHATLNNLRIATERFETQKEERKQLELEIKPLIEQKENLEQIVQHLQHQQQLLDKQKKQLEEQLQVLNTQKSDTAKDVQNLEEILEDLRLTILDHRDILIKNSIQFEEKTNIHTYKAGSVQNVEIDFSYIQNDIDTFIRALRNNMNQDTYTTIRQTNMSDFTMLTQLLNTQSNDRDFFTNLKIFIDLIVPQAHRDVKHAEFYDNVGTLFKKLAVKNTHLYTLQTTVTSHMRNTLIKKIQKVIYDERTNPSSSKKSSYYDWLMGKSK